MLRLHISHQVSLFVNVAVGLGIDRLQVFDQLIMVYIYMLEYFLEVLAFYPFIDELVLFQDVQVNARMPGCYAVHLCL